MVKIPKNRIEELEMKDSLTEAEQIELEQCKRLQNSSNR